MKKSYRRLMISITSLITSFVLLISCMVFPASAASDDDDIFYDVLEFGTANGSGTNIVSGSLPLTVVYESAKLPFKYVDMVVSTDIPDLTVTYAGIALNVLKVSTTNINTYRVYGDLVGDPSGYLTFTFSGSGGTTVIFEQLKVTSLSFNQQFIPSIGSLFCDSTEYNTSYVVMESPSSDVRITFDEYQFYGSDTFYAEINPLEWKKFDYVDLFFTVSGLSIDSIVASAPVNNNSVSVPFSISYLDSEYSYINDVPSGGSITSKNSVYFICARLDLTDLDRSQLFEPHLEIYGTYAPNLLVDQYIELSGVTGILIPETPSSLSIFWQRLQGLLVALFSGDKEAADAGVVQEQVDYDVNLHVIEAVDNWDGNIEYVESGFSSGLTFVTPALAWIGNLATKIFVNIGSFGSIYLLIGMMSVIMLLLSKSGIAAKLSNSARGSGGGKKNA